LLRLGLQSGLQPSRATLHSAGDLCVGELEVPNHLTHGPWQQGTQLRLYVRVHLLGRQALLNLQTEAFQLRFRHCHGQSLSLKAAAKTSSAQL
jgi:hypothetical protein